jgi:hypothetical protein
MKIHGRIIRKREINILMNAKHKLGKKGLDSSGFE